MHVVTALLYSVTVWLILLACSFYVGGFWLALGAGPFVVSGLALVILVVDQLATWTIRRLRPKPAPEAAPDTSHREAMTI